MSGPLPLERMSAGHAIQVLERLRKRYDQIFRDWARSGRFDLDSAEACCALDMAVDAVMRRR